MALTTVQPSRQDLEDRAQAHKRFKRCFLVATAGELDERGEEWCAPLIPPGHPQGLDGVMKLFHDVAELHGVKRLEAVIEASQREVALTHSDPRSTLFRNLEQQLDIPGSDGWRGYYVL